MAGQYDDYAPIPAEDLPVKYAGCFGLLDLTFTPPNDFDRVMTITGHTLQLITDESDGGRRSKQLVMHAGYQKAIWELREGHLRYCPSQDRLWRRDPDVADHPGDRRLLNSWHPVKTIEDEYHIGNGANDRSRNYSMSATIMREAKRAQWFKQVQRGVRIDPCVWFRQNGRVVCLRGDEDMAVTQTFDPTGMGNAAIEQATRICRWLTADDKSCANLLRMFATPWLEPFKQLTYVLSGHGGDGKTLLMLNAIQGVLGERKSFPAFKATDYCGGTYTLARESMNDAMAGKAFAYDDEAGEITDAMLPALRALSTGSRVQARVTGGKYYAMTPTATIVLLTNMPFADSSEPSDRRRFVKVEMHSREGRSYDEYHAIELFIRDHPAAFYAASCSLWEQGDEPELVNLSPSRAISDEMYWLISEILTNEEKYGRPIASRDAYRDEFHASIPRETMALLGLANGTTRMLGSRMRIVQVKDTARFDVYRQAVESESDDEDDQPARIEAPKTKAVAMPGVDSLMPLDPPVSCRDGALIVERACRGEIGFAYCEGKRKGDQFDEKVSLSWKRLNPNDTTHATADSVRQEWTRYCCPPLGRTFVIDCDTDKDHPDRPHGFQLLQALVGPYGGAALPSTLAVRSPHGLHLYYRVPAGWEPSQLLNAVHPEGIPIDLRVSNKGYVLGPGSRANGGDYLLVDTPPESGIPDATPELMAFLDSHEYTDRPKNGSPSSTVMEPVRLSLEQVMADDMTLRREPGGRPDMSPVPEGQRNQVLHDWAYGRAVNHPENRPAIERDLYERGRASGLKDPELATIWKSITRQLGKN